VLPVGGRTGPVVGYTGPPGDGHIVPGCTGSVLSMIGAIGLPTLIGGHTCGGCGGSTIGLDGRSALMP
jgi:hypothetical protein